MFHLMIVAIIPALLMLAGWILCRIALRTLYMEGKRWMAF